MKVYKGYFKCRLCGKEFPYWQEDSQPTRQLEMIVLAHKDEVVSHTCGNGDFGVADFIGIKWKEFDEE